MAFAVTNSSVTDTSKILRTGNKIYFRKTGATTWVDFGWPFNVSPTQNITFSQLMGNRTGVAVQLRNDMTEAAFGVEFDTVSVKDSDVYSLYTGGTAVTGGTGITNATGFALKAGTTLGRCIWVQEDNAGGTAMIMWMPAAAVSGNGEGEQDGYHTLKFKIDRLAKAGYVPDAALGTYSGSTSSDYGINFLLTNLAQLPALLDKLDAEP